MNRSEKIQISFLVLIAIAIACLIIAIVVIVKNIDEIKNDPFEYGMNKMGIENCQCFHSEGYYVSYPGGIIKRPVFGEGG